MSEKERQHEEVPVQNREEIYRMIEAEREFQIELWGFQDDNTDQQWLSILTEEVGEFAKAINDGHPILLKQSELVQIAAVAVSAIESLNKREVAQ